VLPLQLLSSLNKTSALNVPTLRIVLYRGTRHLLLPPLIHVPSGSSQMVRRSPSPKSATRRRSRLLAKRLTTLNPNHYFHLNYEHSPPRCPLLTHHPPRLNIPVSRKTLTAITQIATIHRSLQSTHTARLSRPDLFPRDLQNLTVICHIILQNLLSH